MGLVIELVSLRPRGEEQGPDQDFASLSKVLVNGKTREVLQPVEDSLRKNNVKAVEYVDDLGKYVDYEVKPNLRSRGPSTGKGSAPSSLRWCSGTPRHGVSTGAREPDCDRGGRRLRSGAG